MSNSRIPINQTSFTEGYYHGSINKDNIKNSINEFLLEIDLWEYNIEELREKANQIEELYVEAIPRKIMWMKGVEKATCLAYDDILLLNCYDKLVSDVSECTNIMAHGKATRDNVTIVAKNRDSPKDSVNSVEVLEHRYPEEEFYRAAYIKIPQVKETYKVIGSKKVGRWGYGQGINEFQVCVTDGDSNAMDDLAYEKGLHDNDYVRLTLERSKTAKEGVEIIAGLTEKYGQALNAVQFFIGDPDEVWLMEVAGYRWVAKRYTNTVMAIANQHQIADDYDLASNDLISYALKKGLIEDEVEKINFREVYGAKQHAPKPEEIKIRQWPLYKSQVRYDRAMELLNEKMGDLTLEDFMRILRDHYEEVTLENGKTVDMHQIPYYSSDYESIGQHVRALCHHDIRGNTCVSSIFIIRPNKPNELGVMWNALGQACQSIYVPIYVGTTYLPESFSGSEEAAIFYNIRDKAFGSYKNYQSVIREVFDPAEKMSIILDSSVREKASKELESGNVDLAEKILTDFSQQRMIGAIRLANIALEKIMEVSVKKLAWSK
jgi:dipeptidase